MPVELYLKENIDNQITIEPWQDKSKFPIFLRDIYNFYEMTIFDKPLILLEILNEAPGVEAIQKHIKRIEELTNQQTVLYYRKITRYRRKSLIENRISFVVEDGQMFLPFLGLDFKKNTQGTEEKTGVFSASAQLAYLFFLYNKDKTANATDFAKEMRFTVMTASRALNDLYDAKLITFETGGKTGRSKKYRRIPDPEYFKKGLAHIKSPIKKVVYVNLAPEGALIAGLDALANISMINSSGHAVRAISQKQFGKEALEIIKNRDIVKDQKLIELEIWEYDPTQLTDMKYVDIMSLYASLREKKDERIEQALQEVLRGETWYTD